jgi:hypothetical protein
MESTMEDTTLTKSLAQQCAEMAAILGMDEPVREEVLRAAVADSTYAHNLLVCRGHREYLEHLLSNPPQVAPRQEEAALGTATLARNAAESLVRWARTGFSTVEEAIYRQRLEACAQCPNLQAPPEKRSTLYRLAGASANERAVCRKCGCVVTVKARRSSDTCPDPHPEHEGFNRWGDPLPAGT